MRKRILQIVPTFDWAGTEKQMSLLARGLPREEFEVHLCALLRGGPLAAELHETDVPTSVIGTRFGLDPQAIWRLWHYVVQLRPDLIHTAGFAPNAYGHGAAQLCGARHLVADPVGSARLRDSLELAVDRHVARRSSQVVGHSDRVRDFYLQQGLPAEKVCVIAVGVVATAPPEITRRQLLAELGLPPQSRLVGVVGPLRPRKRLKDVIWAADLLKVIRDDVHLLIVGDGPHRDRLRKFRDQAVIRDKVHFLGQRGDMPRLLGHLDVFWSTTADDGHSHALLEAMAAGVPVVATDTASTRDLVVEGVTGYLVPVGDRAGFTRRTNKLLDDAALARRLGQAGQQQARDQFSAEKMIERYAELYRELLA